MKTQSLLKTALIAAGFSAFTLIGSAEAQVVYFNENMDGPDYTSGAGLPTGFGVINNGAWNGPTSAIASSTESFSSPNSVQITGGSLAQGTFGTTNTAATPATGAVDFHFALNTTSGGSGTVARLFDSASNLLTELSIGYQAFGELTLDTDTGFIDITSYTPNTWYNVDVLAPANPGASQYTINVYNSTDTTLLGTATGNFLTPSTTGNYAFFQLQNVNAQSTFFDNISLTTVPAAVPEPSTYALMGLGALALLVISRRRRTA